MNFPERDSSTKHHEAIQPCPKDEKNICQIDNIVNETRSDSKQIVSKHAQDDAARTMLFFREKFVNYLFYISAETIQYSSI